MAEQSEIFTKQIQALVTYATAMEGSIRGQNPSQFFVPGQGSSGSGWSGDLFDLEGMSAAFDREEIHQMFRAAVKDETSGSVGDLMAIVMQGDFIASLERAYRARHQSSVRARAHAAARHRGHSHAQGVLQGGLVGYLKNILKQGRS